jgi:hypothetical protein
MKTNFRKNEDNPNNNVNSSSNVAKKDLSPKEFEKFIVDSGAKGSFMVYRSSKKDDELGIDEL